MFIEKCRVGYDIIVQKDQVVAPCLICTMVSRGALTLILFIGACAPAAPPEDQISAVVVQTMIAETGPLTIDGTYHSMEGPWQRVAIDTTNIAWITGFRTDVIDATSGERLGDEFFCHSQLQLATSARLAVAATGIEEIRFPAGFGLPP